MAAIDLYTDIRGEGMPILCLHGHPGNSQSLSVFTDALSPHYRTISPDLRGYGRSHTSLPFSMEAHLEDLEALLTRLDLDKFWLLGWSLGGILALELALRHPEQVLGIIGVATAARPRSEHPPVSRAMLAYSALAGISNGVFPGRQWIIDHWGRRSLFRYLVSRQTPAVYRYLAREGISAYLGTTPLARRALSQALRDGYDRRSQLSQLHCPCLWLIGEGDRHITPASSHETARLLPHCDVRVYEETAHLFPWEVPHLVCQDILTWLTHPERQALNYI
ncbi:alpha/beta fold hydrolase [Sodalinema gerasimenkoae]|uniref:alpha/beta fold hydrolase n=1 Tax=Sodalinema gerasimenkoae TaxID=2862348 RepID=UPI00135A5B1B|nr:alpha/beta hydrolase [Sodalinema gerasimenkoae]